MKETFFYVASEYDIPFIAETYNQNIENLHGRTRNFETWKNLLSDEHSTYYILKTTEPVAWFRIETTKDVLWLGMLQVNPKFQRQGFGKNILLFIENLAKTMSIKQIGIHTTEDNIPARTLYQSFDYIVSEIGKCTTADGIERIGYTFFKDI